MWAQLSSAGLGRIIGRQSKVGIKYVGAGKMHLKDRRQADILGERIVTVEGSPEKLGGEGVLRREEGQLHLCLRREAGEEGQVQVD